MSVGAADVSVIRCIVPLGVRTDAGAFDLHQL
jgi:hypothetical protein